MNHLTPQTNYYIGPYRLYGTRFFRTEFDGGYFDSEGKVYYHITDYQGNVTSVMRGDGVVVQTASYYPYGEPWLEPEGGNSRLYGGKERLRSFGLPWYDFGARHLSPDGWTTPDPCAEDFYPLSPYGVCGGDPINYVDQDGCRFTEASMSAVNNLLGEALRGMLSSKVFAMDYAQAFAEMLVMQYSDQLFHIRAISPLGTTGATIYDTDMDAVVFVIPGGAYGSLGLIAHEFKHGYQFLTGEIELAVKGRTSTVPLFFYDLYDEVEAYDRGALFGADYFSIDEIKQMYPYLTSKKSNYFDIPGFDNELSSIKKVEYLQKVAQKTMRAFRVNNQTYLP